MILAMMILIILIMIMMTIMMTIMVSIMMMVVIAGMTIYDETRVILRIIRMRKDFFG